MTSPIQLPPGLAPGSSGAGTRRVPGRVPDPRDHPRTAFAIAQELGIAESPEQTMTGTELDRCSDEELADRIGSIRVFSRVSPEHKVRIVKALKGPGPRA